MISKAGNLKLSVQRGKKEKRMKRSEESLWDLSGTIKKNSLLIIGVTKEEESKKGEEAYLKEKKKAKKNPKPGERFGYPSPQNK